MKKLKGKLSLNKKTIAGLDNMADVKGGTASMMNTCGYSCVLEPGGTYCLACMQPIETEGTCGMQTGLPCAPS